MTEVNYHGETDKYQSWVIVGLKQHFPEVIEEIDVGNNWMKVRFNPESRPIDIIKVNQNILDYGYSTFFSIKSVREGTVEYRME